MEIKEQQLIDSLNKIESEANKPIFSEADYKMFRDCGMSEEQIKRLEHVEMMSNIINILPGDENGINRLVAALGALSKDDVNENLANLKLIVEKDPQTFAQLMALASVAENEADSKK